MGKFYLYNGKIGPSENYLSSHPLEINENDIYNADYHVEDDPDVLYCTRTCADCGATYTLHDAMARYYEIAGDASYANECDGELCADCAAKRSARKFRD